MTKTQAAKDVYDQECKAAQEKYTAVMRAEFPPGTRALFMDAEAKEFSECEVVPEPPGSSWRFSVRVRITKTGAVRSILAHLLVLP